MFWKILLSIPYHSTAFLRNSIHFNIPWRMKKWKTRNISTNSDSDLSQNDVNNAEQATNEHNSLS